MSTDLESSKFLARGQIQRYSVSTVTQGDHRFHTLTIPSDVLGHTCFATTRQEDPETGFQRVLDKDRALEIARYIDEGFGTIPTSIVLSAQPEAEVKIIGSGKTMQFKAVKKAFLILDGQHRVYGFSLSKTRLRVPVVIYNGLSTRDESRLFIDINTKQKPVSNELLLDIKKLAEYENDAERLSGEIFDLFDSDSKSPLLGMLSPATRTKGKLSRVTFYAALKPLIEIFKESTATDVYNAVSAYIRAFQHGCTTLGAKSALLNPTVFRAVIALFPEVGARLKDRREPYTTDNFSTTLAPLFQRIKPNDLLKPSRSHIELAENLSRSFRRSFVL